MSDDFLSHFSSAHLNIIGWGNQAQTWAANLHDSGWSVRVYLRDPQKHPDIPSWVQIKTLSKHLPIEPGLTALLIPDHTLSEFVKDHTFQTPQVLIYAHGWALTTQPLPSSRDLYPVLLAPKAIAAEMRQAYKAHRPFGAVYSLEFVADVHLKEKLRSLILNLASALGVQWGPFEVTCQQETQADLFSEQALLCSLIPELARRSFEFLVNKGIPHELAYLEVWHEMTLITKTLGDIGPEKFFKAISPAALLGAQEGLNTFDFQTIDMGFEKLWANIEDGSFAQQMNNDQAHSLLQDKILKTREDLTNRWLQGHFLQTFSSHFSPSSEKPTPEERT